MMTDRGQLAEGALARRLYQLEVDGADRLIGLARERASVRPARERRRRRRALLGAGLLAAVLVLAIATTPLAQAVMSPVSTLLQEMSGVPPRTTTRLPTDTGVATVTSSGVTVTVLGAYGDQFHTVLYVHAGAMLGPGQLTDETGHTISGGSTQGVGDGVVAMQFDAVPMAGHHDLTLRFTTLLELAGRGAAERAVHGDWTLHVPVDVRVARVFVAEPASGSLGAVHVDVAISGGGDVLYIRLRTSGATLDQLLDAPTGDDRTSGPGPGQLRIQVRDARGRSLTQLAGEASADGFVKGGPVPTTTTWSGSWKANGAGAYQLVLTYRGHELHSRFTVG